MSLSHPRHEKFKRTDGETLAGGQYVTPDELRSQRLASRWILRGNKMDIKEIIKELDNRILFRKLKIQCNKITGSNNDCDKAVLDAYESMLRFINKGYGSSVESGKLGKQVYARYNKCKRKIKWILKQLKKK